MGTSARLQFALHCSQRGVLTTSHVRSRYFVASPSGSQPQCVVSSRQGAFSPFVQWGMKGLQFIEQICALTFKASLVSSQVFAGARVQDFPCVPLPRRAPWSSVRSTAPRQVPGALKTLETGKFPGEKEEFKLSFVPHPSIFFENLAKSYFAFLCLASNYLLDKAPKISSPYRERRRKTKRTHRTQRTGAWRVVRSEASTAPFQSGTPSLSLTAPPL